MLDSGCTGRLAYYFCLDTESVALMWYLRWSVADLASNTSIYSTTHNTVCPLYVFVEPNEIYSLGFPEIRDVDLTIVQMLRAKQRRQRGLYSRTPLDLYLSHWLVSASSSPSYSGMIAQHYALLPFTRELQQTWAQTYNSLQTTGRTSGLQFYCIREE